MRLLWTPEAVARLGDIQDYIRQHNPTAAQAIVDRLLRAAAGLADFPGMGRPSGIEDVRELVVTRTPFILRYTVIDETVFVVTVLHGARDRG